MLNLLSRTISSRHLYTYLGVYLDYLSMLPNFYMRYPGSGGPYVLSRWLSDGLTSAASPPSPRPLPRLLGT